MTNSDPDLSAAPDPAIPDELPRRSGVQPTEVARRLGHSVAVLLKVYANCVDGGDGMNDKIGGALG